MKLRSNKLEINILGKKKLRWQKRNYIENLYITGLFPVVYFLVKCGCKDFPTVSFYTYIKNTLKSKQ